ncbi:uracil-DNA glycosylase [Aquamicrobium soli]|jgi:DNA polymerase|uniref:Type-4 uracil-DNA glycosylase n=1 Tax=Aquamicrobium soli TaxID=1811518 RepID=A0ABV7KIP4_9HYPH
MISTPSPDRPGLRELLSFYANAGVDEALSEEPIDRFAQAAATRPERAQPVPSSDNDAGQNPGTRRPERESGKAAPRPGPATPAAVPDEAQAGLARELAAKACNLDELREAVASFEGCNLKSTAKNTVFSDGNPQARLMLVGEAPGRDEDIEGRPFVGRSGQLLDKMLAAIGLDRNSVYIANVIPWRPPGNRTPTPHETQICRPFIERQIELVNPAVLVHLGGASAKTLLDTSEGILRLRGQWRSYATASGIVIPAMPTLHPAYLLRTPNHKKLAWRDFLEVKMKLRETGAA